MNEREGLRRWQLWQGGNIFFKEGRFMISRFPHVLVANLVITLAISTLYFVSVYVSQSSIRESITLH